MEIKIKVADYKARWWKYYLQNKFSNKIVALLRKQFGGHAIYTQASKRNTRKKK